MSQSFAWETAATRYEALYAEVAGQGAAQAA